MKGKDASPHAPVFSPDGTRVAAAGDRVRVWDLNKGGPAREFPTPAEAHAVRSRRDVDSSHRDQALVPPTPA